MIIVYGAIMSPFVRKVLMLAAEKGVEVELRGGGMGRDTPEFAEASPFGKMPAMRDTSANDDGSDFLLADSTAICAYIDAKHPEKPLIPAEPRARGQVIWYDEFADTILMAAGGKMFFNRIVLPHFMKREGDLAAADEAQVKDMPRLLAWLDGQLSGRAFLVGVDLTLADIAVAVMFNNIKGAGFAIDAVAYPDLARWLDTVTARPSIAGLNAKMDSVLAALPK